MADKREAVWRVKHPDYGETVVLAMDWRLATVAAAEWWEVPWKKVAADCDVTKMGDIPRNVCIDCGKIFHAEGLRCEVCTSIARNADAKRKAEARKYWKELYAVGKTEDRF